jgi:hypothetical protein
MPCECGELKNEVEVKQIDIAQSGQDASNRQQVLVLVDVRLLNTGGIARGSDELAVGEAHPESLIRRLTP